MHSPKSPIHLGSPAPRPMAGVLAMLLATACAAESPADGEVVVDPGGRQMPVMLTVDRSHVAIIHIKLRGQLVTVDRCYGVQLSDEEVARFVQDFDGVSLVAMFGPRAIPDERFLFFKVGAGTANRRWLSVSEVVAYKGIVALGFGENRQVKGWAYVNDYRREIQRWHDGGKHKKEAK